ncbi:MAG: GntR family transcriptional regulator [Desulfobacterales bacterium]|nr:GntR family transcriptional regulator [Desulfobacterales bacterium]
MSGKGSKFMEIAEAIMEEIIAGRIASGDKVPSVRETAMRMGVTPNTAANAHGHLKDLGITVSVHGSGSTVRPAGPEICRSYMYEKFIDLELPVLRHRMRLLGLSEEKIVALLKGGAPPGKGTQE